MGEGITKLRRQRLAMPVSKVAGIRRAGCMSKREGKGVEHMIHTVWGFNNYMKYKWAKCLN